MKVVSKSPPPRIVNGDPVGPGSECCPHECGPFKLEGPARPVIAEAVAQEQLAAPSTYIATHTARPSSCHTPERASPSTFKTVSEAAFAGRQWQLDDPPGPRVVRAHREALRAPQAGCLRSVAVHQSASGDLGCRCELWCSLEAAMVAKDPAVPRAHLGRFSGSRATLSCP